MGGGGAVVRVYGSGLRVVPRAGGRGPNRTSQVREGDQSDDEWKKLCIDKGIIHLPYAQRDHKISQNDDGFHEGLGFRV